MVRIELSDDEPVGGGAVPCDPPVRSVRQVNALLQQTLAMHLPPLFLVQGELSNFRTYDRGHAFFTLKEPGAELPCVMWKDALAKLKFRPRDGMAVVARGSVRLYEPQGKIQLYVESLLPQGMGELELAFRQLCEKLKGEGLFELGRKRPIPRLPQRVAILTSRTGDVLHDVLTTAYRRYPGLHAMLFPVPVQGATAAPKIAEAIGTLNRHAASLGGIDLILLVRGGGSLEDLWAFNEEAVARAIVASRIPVATGIGHEPDTTIADLVGDLRGPTPTGVTELTIPDARALRKEVDALAAGLSAEMARWTQMASADVRRMMLELGQALRHRVYLRRQHVDGLTRLVNQIEPRHAIAQGWRRVEEAQRDLDGALHARVRAARDRVAALERRLERATPVVKLQRCADHVKLLESRLASAMKATAAARAARLTALQRQLHAVGPQAVLERGYSITLDGEGRLVRSAGQVARGDVLTTRLKDGEVKSTVGQPRQAKLF